MAFITTSKKTANKLAEALEQVLPSSEYQPRGNKSIDQIIRIARKKGHERVIIITEKPPTIQFIKLDQNNWQWIQKTIKIKEYTITKHSKIATLQSTPELAQLFDVQNQQSQNQLIQQSHSLLFTQNTKTLLKIEEK
ncbi:hypothetical protein K8R43_01640 [archaeon]|nr:hypothetical protein [archaeon]